MGNDIKSGFGYIIPATALVAFVIAIFAEEFLLSVFFASAGILVWFLYMQVMDTPPPPVLGNFIVLFSILITVGLFLAFGIAMNPHGGYEIIPEGVILSFIILFFGVLAGILFKRSPFFSGSREPTLTEEERLAVEESLKKDNNGESSPKVVVIKPEQEGMAEKPKQPQYSQYSMNPYFYPEDYDYEDDEEYEEYDDYDDEDEYEEDEDEYEDEYEEEK